MSALYNAYSYGQASGPVANRSAYDLTPQTRIDTGPQKKDPRVQAVEQEEFTQFVRTLFNAMSMTSRKLIYRDSTVGRLLPLVKKSHPLRGMKDIRQALAGQWIE